MMRMRTGAPPASGGGGGGSGSAGGQKEWEMRPGGMLVQKRTDSDQNRPPPPTIRVRVKYGSIYHQVNICSQATFGELKKMLSGPTGLHHEDQKLMFKDKERDNKAFLDTSGVKDKSKVVLVEDPISQEKRYLEMRKNARIEKAAKTISEISLDVDRLAVEVVALETLISKGRRVVEKDVVNLIELLMNQLVKLDGIAADGDVKLQRKMQIKRVQKYVETLDLLKIKNAMQSANGDSKHSPDGKIPSPGQQQQQQHHHTRHSSSGHSPAQVQQPQSRRSTSSGDVVITTQWETFDSTPSSLPAASSTNSGSAQPRFDWDLLL